MKKASKKPAVTVKSLRKEMKLAEDKLVLFKDKVRAFILASQTINRDLMTIEPSNKAGMINGLTIPELITLVNLSANTGEVIQLRTINDGHDLVVSTRERVVTPWELL